MREAGARLLGRDRIGRDVFLRGAPEGLRLDPQGRLASRAISTCSRLMAWFAPVPQPAMHVVHARSVMTLDEAIERVGKMIGWRSTGHFLRASCPRPRIRQFRRSCLASSFLAALELARRGRLDIAQDEPFAPIRLKVAA